MIDLRRNGLPPSLLSLPSTQRDQGHTVTTWAVFSDQPYAYVDAALRLLTREGLVIRQHRLTGPPPRWGLDVARSLVAGHCQAAVAFTLAPGLLACVANKLPGVRAVPISTIAQANQAALDLGANLLAVEMPGRTYFEVRQTLRLLFSPLSCPPELAALLQEVEHHAHR